jgi:hypothetical protein
MVKLSDGLIRFLEDYEGHLIVITFKDQPSGEMTTGYLMGFDANIILINPVFYIKDKYEQKDIPQFIDMESIATISSFEKGGFESYKKAFEEFKSKYELQKKRMDFMDAAETT